MTTIKIIITGLVLVITERNNNARIKKKTPARPANTFDATADAPSLSSSAPAFCSILLLNLKSIFFV